MPPTKNALLRYAAIDACLQRTTQQWSFERLRREVAAVLAEHVDSAGGVSVRTLREDLKNMRPGGATGYNAPILFEPERGYYYGEAGYSIFASPVTVHDLPTLQQAVGLLRQLTGLGLSRELGEVVERLELRLSGQAQAVRETICQFEQPTSYQGQEWLGALYVAVQQQQVQRIIYQPFGATQPDELLVHPYLLKQYNGRWFLIGQREGWQTSLSVFALDRIQQLHTDKQTFLPHAGEVNQYFTHLIGVSILPHAELAEVRLRFTKSRLPYVLTKPLHASQTLDKNTDEKVLQVVPTRELVSVLLSYGGDVEVLAPAILREQLAEEAKRMLGYYL
ncbi:WYL domain-containing protein [Hymenobacter sp. BT507]|uniref:WYL domain-containing protein n=1 Tax=Hymenobacter citatus TaxID=2763506 RepID=A0ABR7MMV2_9BACT|nr:WYL domain-containing protein [Hymenobacter citatus]MBC6612407.1 WYL domain-containing protein [Hymenobacter citatus]